jgi:hypothetical protein
MRKRVGAVAIAGCMIVAILRSAIAAPGEADIPQQPLAKYLTPAEVAKRQKLQNGKGAQTQPGAPAPASGMSTSVRNGRGNPVILGGPPSAKKNAAVAGKADSRKNAAAVGGPPPTPGAN